MIVFGAGAAMFAATAQVYFRDLTNFLPYFTRIWLYTSPILFYVEDIPDVCSQSWPQTRCIPCSEH